MAEKVTLQTTIRRITGRNPIDPYTWMPELTNTEGIDLTKGITFPGVTFYKLEGGEYVPKAYRIFLEEGPDGTWMFEWEDEEPMKLAKAINDYINVDKGLTHHAFQEPSEYVKAEMEETSGGRRRRRCRKTRKGRKSRRCRTKRRRSRR
jgi:hypothetical protein